MKRIVTAALCLAIPGLLLLNSWEGYRYNVIADQVAALEARQSELLEANRDAIGQIAYESSAARVEEKAAALGLTQKDPAAITRLRVNTAAADPQGTAATNPQSTVATNPRGTAATNPRGTAATNPRGTAATNPRGTVAGTQP